MLTIINIPDECRLNKVIPIDKFFSDTNPEISSSVESIQWIASLKPSILGIQSIKNETIRYEEIQILDLVLNGTEYLYDIARSIYKSIKYPCLLIFHYQNKLIFSSCQFKAGRIDYDDNILRTIHFSHWIYPDLLSDSATEFLEIINQSIHTKGDLYEIYTQLSHAIENFSLSGITQNHVELILRDMLGSCSPKRRDTIMKYCSPYKKFTPTDASKASKYDKTKRNPHFFKYSYDLEDVWYCLLNYEPTKKIIAGRRYRDIEDLIFSIDTKLENYSDRW